MNGAGTESTDNENDYLARLIEALRADPERADYYVRLLQPLVQYDRDHHGDLLKTLTLYLRYGGNAVQAANALYIHRNSLRYRLARIAALTGLDIDDPDARLAVQVGLLLVGLRGRE